MSDEVIMHDVNCQSDAGRVRKVYQVISEELLGIVDIDMVAMTQKFKGQLHKLSKFNRIQTFQKKTNKHFKNVYITKLPVSIHKNSRKKWSWPNNLANPIL